MTPFRAHNSFTSSSSFFINSGEITSITTYGGAFLASILVFDLGMKADLMVSISRHIKWDGGDFAAPADEEAVIPSQRAYMEIMRQLGF